MNGAIGERGIRGPRVGNRGPRRAHTEGAPFGAVCCRTMGGFDGEAERIGSPILSASPRKRAQNPVCPPHGEGRSQSNTLSAPARPRRRSRSPVGEARPRSPVAKLPVPRPRAAKPDPPSPVGEARPRSPVGEARPRSPVPGRDCPVPGPPSPVGEARPPSAKPAYAAFARCCARLATTRMASRSTASDSSKPM